MPLWLRLCMHLHPVRIGEFLVRGGKEAGWSAGVVYNSVRRLFMARYASAGNVCLDYLQKVSPSVGLAAQLQFLKPRFALVRHPTCCGALVCVAVCRVHAGRITAVPPSMGTVVLSLATLTCRLRPGA